eukprot:TRINITY_DN11902_c0_g1_i2.p1 TRINITY_DN11902_c0_g1~~TRINITY_DN11902_c0_g1_i2.p1  ORF type:complete len:251 (+),score=45.72 TRINITY_DN11902_c0_g1_i2:175-927(+)
MRTRGPYISLHLRYEEDMLAFTGCTHGLSRSEAAELTTLRESTNHWKIKTINSTDQRMKGYCPLTPKEVGIFLRAYGFPSSTLIYVAAGEIYGGTRYLRELKSRFPNILFKENITTGDELEPFSKHASQAAALDYIVSMESDIFIPSYSGNMARAVAGHRRFLGHRRTITPDRKGLVPLFEKVERREMFEGLDLSEKVKEMHKFRQGAPRKREQSIPGAKGKSQFEREESFYENPFPECICKSFGSLKDL